MDTLLRIYEESPSGTVPFPYSGCENTQGFFSWAEWMVSCSWCPFFTLTPNLQYVFAEEELRYFVYDDPTYDFRDFDLKNPDSIADLEYMMKYASAMDPDLREFRDRGGKMLMHHGWGDPIISPYNTILYYEEVENFKKNTNKKFKDVRDFIRLFLAPGMLHCNDGPGPNVVDYLTAFTHSKTFFHEAISEAAVIGIPHDDIEEEIAAVIVLKPGADVTADDLRRYVKSQVAFYKYPRGIKFLNMIPKTAAGKILKRAISVAE